MLIKAISILPSSLKLKGFYVVILALIGTVLEIFSIGLIMPALAILIQGENSDHYIYIRDAFDYIYIIPSDYYMYFGVSVLFFSYMIKAVFLTFSIRLQATFIYKIKAYISERLFVKYICSSYRYHLLVNSSKLIRNLTTETAQFSGFIVSPVIVILSEFSVAVGLAGMLFYLEPTGFTVLICILGCCFYFLNFYTKTRLKVWGIQRQISEAKRLKIAQEALQGIREVKVANSETFLIREYIRHNEAATRDESGQHFVSHLPRIWLEIAGILSVGILTLNVLNGSEDILGILPVLGVFGAAAFRLLPSFNRIISSLQSLRYAYSVLSTVEADLNLQEENLQSGVSIEFKNHIQFESVDFRYPNSNIDTLKKLSFRINKGEMVGIVGKSGAGKSTLVDLILGLIEPTNGLLTADGHDIKNAKAFWRSMIGYVQQDIYLIDDSIKNNIALGIAEEHIDMDRIALALETAKLGAFVSELQQGIDTPVGEGGTALSGGQRQRLALARAMYSDPEILILDEATSGLDNKTTLEIVREIQNLKGEKTIIMITHQTSTIKNCDRVWFVSEGQMTEMWYDKKKHAWRNP